MEYLKYSKYITDREFFGAILEWDSFSLSHQNLRNSDISLGRWVSEEDVTISKQTFMVILYPLEDLGAKNLVIWCLVMPYFFRNLPLSVNN